MHPNCDYLSYVRGSTYVRTPARGAPARATGRSYCTYIQASKYRYSPKAPRRPKTEDFVVWVVFVFVVLCCRARCRTSTNSLYSTNPSPLRVPFPFKIKTQTRCPPATTKAPRSIPRYSPWCANDNLLNVVRSNFNDKYRNSSRATKSC